MSSLGQRLKIKIGMESEKERKKRISLEKKEREKHRYYNKKVRNPIIKTDKKMTTEEFKAILFKEATAYFLEMKRQFIVDESNKTFLKCISLYFTNSLDFETETNGELRKGLLVYGDCGSGKSSIFDIIQNISLKYNLKHLWFKNVSVQDVITDYNINGEEVVKRLITGDIHFDDLGTEKLANSWGVREKLMGRILEVRYNNFKKYGIKTFVTTNLSIAQIKEYYGVRVADRLYEMFNFIELTGNSRRF
jgi:DNA replication protein DnaC